VVQLELLFPLVALLRPTLAGCRVRQALAATAVAAAVLARTATLVLMALVAVVVAEWASMATMALRVLAPMVVGMVVNGIALLGELLELQILVVAEVVLEQVLQLAALLVARAFVLLSIGHRGKSWHTLQRLKKASSLKLSLLTTSTKSMVKNT
jgi:hypothetical protein